MTRSQKATASNEWAQDKDPDFLRAMLIGLSIACPLNKNLDQCLLRLDRALSFEEKIAWAESLSDNDINQLYSVHHQCFHTRSTTDK